MSEEVRRRLERTLQLLDEEIETRNIALAKNILLETLRLLEPKREEPIYCLRCGATVTEIEQLEEGPVEYGGQRGFLCYKCTDELLDEACRE
jgi:hypothetical protein